MKYDYIKVVHQIILGVRNPSILVDGLITARGCIFEVYADGKKKECDFFVHGEQFSVVADLTRDEKIIEVYVINNKKKHLIVTKKNNLRTRIKAKIKYSILFEIFNFIKKIAIIFKRLLVLIYKGIRIAWKEHHFLIPPILWKKYFKVLKEKLKNLGVDSPYYNPFNLKHYRLWLNKQPQTVYEDLKYNPLISIIIPVYNIKGNLLRDCLESVLNQKYENFEICIADDCSTNKETLDTLKEYENKDSRIKIMYRKKNGHISESSNSAISIATGEFIGFLDNDDLLTEDALYLVAKELNKDKTLDLIYTDEDKMDLDGNLCEPFFKPDFSPDTLLSFNYITHFAVYRKSLVEKLGGLRSEYNGAQDFDLVLRVTEKTKKIAHIPKVVYHWRKVEGSTALKMSSKNYALEAGKKAIEDALKRRKIKGTVSILESMAHYIVEYDIEKEPLISILIPTRDFAKVTEKCLDSLYKKTVYKNFEVILINNGSKEEQTYKLFEKYNKKYDNFRVLDADIEFNYSILNNMAAKEAKGEYIVLLNNDTEIITPKWLNYMVGYAMQKHIGAVGAKLFYPDDTIQHCGVVLGIANTASHFGIGIPSDDNGPFARYAVPYDNGAVTAACLMINKEKFFEVGGLDEEMVVAFNDVLLNIRLLEKGYYNVCVPQAQLYHHESKSRGLDTTGEKYKRFLVESEKLRNKGGDYIKKDPFYNINLSKWYPMMLPKEDEE